MIEAVNSTAEIWFRNMASAGVQATLLAVAILGIVCTGRRWSPALRHALLMVALLKFVMPPALSLPTGLFSHFKPNPPAESAMTSRNLLPIVQDALWPAEHQTAASISAQDPRSEKASNPALSLASRAKHSLTSKAWLMMVHLLGAFLVLAWVLLQKIRLLRLSSSAIPATDPELLQIHDELCRSMRPVRRPRLLLTRENHAPMTFGTWRPVVVLPRDLVAALPKSEIRVILGHELAHHRRWDLWLNWLQIPISAAWWFNPVYWALVRRIRIVREDCCDDLVVASGLTSGEGYCRTLLQAARVASGSAMAGASLAYISESPPLQRRFQRIMGADFIRTPKVARTGILAVSALGLLLLPGVEPGAFNGIPVSAGASAGSIMPASDRAVQSATEALVLIPPAATSRLIEGRTGPQQVGRVAVVPNPRPPQTHVTGKVVDAGTKLPVDSFSVTRSRRYVFGEWVDFAWAVLGEKGKFALDLDDSLPNYGIRIEAFGYFPSAVLSVETGKGDRNLEFALVQGDGPTGIVLLPGGGPAVGATVSLFGGSTLIVDGVVGGTTQIPGKSISAITMEGPEQLRNSSKSYGSTASVFTDSSGRFAFGPMADAHTVVVIHEKGFATASVERLAVSPALILEPWGRVEGFLRIGDQPGMNRTVALTKGTAQKALNPLPPNFNLTLTAQTDATGKFVFPKVPPGMQMVALRLPGYKGNASRSIETQATPVFVGTGETASITLGGTGRPVIGRVVAAGADSPIDWDAPGSNHYMTLVISPPQRPSTPEAASAYLQSEEYKIAYQAQRRYGFEIAPDGSFRIEDVPAGTYRLNIWVGAPVPQPIYDPARPDASPVLSTGLIRLGSVAHEITVPEMPGGCSDVPLDIGIITMQITAKK